MELMFVANIWWRKERCQIFWGGGFGSIFPIFKGFALFGFGYWLWKQNIDTRVWWVVYSYKDLWTDLVNDDNEGSQHNTSWLT